jgi:ribosomal protein S27AE
VTNKVCDEPQARAAEHSCDTCGDVGYVDVESDDFSMTFGHFTRERRSECPNCQAGVAWGNAQERRLGAGCHFYDEASS